MLMQQESEKYYEKHGFGVICVSLHKEPVTKMALIRDPTASHVTLVGLRPIKYDIEKQGIKHGFVVICVSLHNEPRTMMG